MDSLDAQLEAYGASRIVAEAWPGARFCGARCSELTQDVELKATIRGDLPTAVGDINGDVIRRALRSWEVGPLLDAVDHAVPQWELDARELELVDEQFGYPAVLRIAERIREAHRGK